MRKWALLLLALFLTVAMGAGAEEFFSEESFSEAGGVGEENLFEEAFFGGEDLFSEDLFDAELPSEQISDETEEPEMEDRSLFTVAPESEATPCEHTKDDYWKAAPELTAVAVKGGKATLTWMQALYYGNEGTESSNYNYVKVFPSKDIQYYVYELDEYGAMFQATKKPIAIGKKYIFPNDNHPDMVFVQTTTTISNLSSGSHTFAVRAEKLTASAEDKKLFIEEYGEISNQFTVNCFYDDPYKISSLNYYHMRPYDNMGLGELDLAFVADYDLANHMMEDGGWFELVAKVNFEYWDYEAGKPKKGSGTAYYELEPEIDSDGMPYNYGYNPKGKGLGNPVVCNQYLDLDETSIEIKNDSIDPGEVYLLGGSFTLQYVVPVLDKNGEPIFDKNDNLKTKVMSKLTGKLRSPFSGGSGSYTEAWKIPYFDVECAEQHKVNLYVYTYDEATEYVLGGLADKLSAVRNNMFEYGTMTYIYEDGYKETESELYPLEDEKIYEDYDCGAWLLVNTKTNEVIDVLECNGGDELIIEGVEAAGDKTTAKISVQPKQNIASVYTYTYNEKTDKETEKYSGKKSTSGKTYSKNVTLSNYWKMAPHLYGGEQSGDRRVELSVYLEKGTSRINITGFEDSIDVLVARSDEEELAPLVVTVLDPNPGSKKPVDLSKYIITNSWDDGFLIDGPVKKEGNIKFTATSLDADNPKNKGDMSSTAYPIPVIAAKDSSAVHIEMDWSEEDMVVRFKHINENVDHYAVTASYSQVDIYGTQVKDITMTELGRAEVSADEADDDGSLTVTLDTRPDIEDVRYSILVEGFTKDGARIVTGWSLSSVQ